MDGGEVSVFLPSFLPPKSKSRKSGYKYFIIHAITGKEGKLHVFHLTDFEGEQNEDIVRNRAECKHHKLEATKGTSLLSSRNYCRHDASLCCLGLMFWPPW
jgi:hypothetical protein